MSLKAFHVVFVTAAFLMMAGIGAWSLRPSSGFVWLGVLALVGATALAFYGAWFLKKMKGVSYL